MRVPDLDAAVAALAKRLGVEEALLDHATCAALARGIDASNWPAYAEQWPALLAGARPLRVTPGTRGRMGWLRSYVVYHLHVELLRGEELRLPSERAKKPVAKAVAS
jgi:hypothetical protein